MSNALQRVCNGWPTTPFVHVGHAVLANGQDDKSKGRFELLAIWPCGFLKGLWPRYDFIRCLLFLANPLYKEREAWATSMLSLLCYARHFSFLIAGEKGERVLPGGEGVREGERRGRGLHVPPIRVLCN